MIKLTSVSRNFGERTILEGVDLCVAAGEVVAVLGASGAGKSTLLRIIGGLDRQYLGCAQVDGRDLSTLSESQLAGLRAEHIGMVFQRFHLLDHLNAAENIELPGLFGGPDSRRAEALLDAVGLSGRGADYPTNLSGGECQRLAIARALRNEPAVLLADEPTGNLDEVSGAAVIERLRNLAKEKGAASLWVTHEARVAEAADRVLRLQNGRLETLS
jgi:ABC-type lipoprotein export system ATPase subunit